MVKLYSNGCPKCRILEAELNKRGVVYEKVTDFPIEFFASLNLCTMPILEIREGEFLLFESAMTYIRKEF